MTGRRIRREKIPFDVRASVAGASPAERGGDMAHWPVERGAPTHGAIDDAMRPDQDHASGKAPWRSGTPSWTRFVRIRKFAEVTGYTERAVYMKIARGVWLAGQEYRRAPDGNICIDMEGYTRWVEGGPAPAFRR